MLHMFFTWNGVVGYISFCMKPSNGGENVFLWHLMEVFPHCSIIKGLLYAMSIFNGSASPLFVRQKDIGWVVKVSIIKISYSRNIFHHRNNCKACNKTYHWSKYCEDIVEILNKVSMLIQTKAWMLMKGDQEYQHIWKA